MGQGRGSRVDAVMAQHFEPTMGEFVLAFEQVSDALGDKVECLHPLQAMSQISRLVLAQTACFNVGDALIRTVFPAVTLTFSGFADSKPSRAFVLRTVNVPKPGRVNLPSFFSSLTLSRPGKRHRLRRHVPG